MEIFEEGEEDDKENEKGEKGENEEAEQSSSREITRIEKLGKDAPPILLERGSHSATTCKQYACLTIII